MPGGFFVCPFYFVFYYHTKILTYLDYRDFWHSLKFCTQSCSCPSNSGDPGLKCPTVRRSSAWEPKSLGTGRPAALAAAPSLGRTVYL